MVKDPASHNLWICQGTGCDVDNGDGELVILERVFGVANDPEGVGAYEFQVKFDHKIFDIDVQETEWLSADGTRTVNCTMEIITENDIRFGCVSYDPTPGDGNIPPGPTTDGVAAIIKVKPEPDLRYRLTPGQENGVVRTLLDENCELANILGDPLNSGTDPITHQLMLLPGILEGGEVESCTDTTLTVRILEGDLNTDCKVDVVDDQAMAYRYGASFGNLLYDPWYDLEPALKDFDVDIKDLQKVFGRNGSVCSVSGKVADGTIPAQEPLPPPPAP